MQWHGFYEVAKHFYFEFLPEVKEKDPKLAEGILSQEEHQWIKGINKDDINKTIQFYKNRYRQ